MKTVSYQDVVIRLAAWVAGFGSQKQAARVLGVSPQYLNDILRGSRTPTDRVLLKVGLKRMTVYVELEPAGDIPLEFDLEVGGAVKE